MHAAARKVLFVKFKDLTHNPAAACVQATELNSVVHTPYTYKPAGLCDKSLNLTNSTFLAAACVVEDVATQVLHNQRQ